jgi:hypothetical protein
MPRPDPAVAELGNHVEQMRRELKELHEAVARLSRVRE